mgnify:CR=1 FL=1
MFDTNKFTQEQSDRIRKQYKNRIPIIIWDIGDNIMIKKRKFIVPIDITVGQFLYVLRKQITNITEADGIFLFIHGNNAIPLMSELIGIVFNNHNDNGFLKLTITKENTFG